MVRWSMQHSLLVLISIGIMACTEGDGGNGDVNQQGKDNDTNGEYLVAHEVCFDSEFSGFDHDGMLMVSSEWESILRAPGSSLYRYPECILEVGFGASGYMCSGDTEENGEYYFYCDEPELEDPQTGEVLEFDTPCIWWIYAELSDTDFCSYHVVCVPEEQLVELGWPEESSFSYHRDEYGFDVCDPSTL